MKIITKENYYKPDDIIQYWGVFDNNTGEQRSVTEADIIDFASGVKLNEDVSEEVRGLFEVSIALYAYGYLYWTFFTIAQEQSFKAFEAAVSTVHTRIYGHNYNKNEDRLLTLSDMISRLIIKGIIPKEKEKKYEALRGFRNMASHPSYQSQWGVVSLDIIKFIANEINSLFDAVKALPKG